MILHVGECVYWGAPEVIYLEGTITRLDEATQTVFVHIDHATLHSAHLIGSEIAFAANGLSPLKDSTPPGVTDKRSTEHLPALSMTDEEKIRAAAAVAVHQQYGYTLPKEEEQALIEQVAQALNSDAAMRARIIASMDEILQREL